MLREVEGAFNPDGAKAVAEAARAAAIRSFMLFLIERIRENQIK